MAGVVLATGKKQRGRRDSHATDQQIMVRRTQLAERERMDSLFARHDDDRRDELNHGQLSRLLCELNGGGVLSEAEVSYSLHLADSTGRGLIRRCDLNAAVVAWKALREDQRRIQERFRHHDVSGSGLLDRLQIERLLREVNRGRAVSQQELEYIIKHADADGNGQIDSDELNSAVALWYLHITKQTEQKELEDARLGFFFCCLRRPTKENYEYPGALSDSDQLLPSNAP
jgi:Ca2+-binding EF-hand superfamily protein